MRPLRKLFLSNAARDYWIAGGIAALAIAMIVTMLAVYIWLWGVE